MSGQTARHGVRRLSLSAHITTAENFNKTNITNRKWEHNVEHRKGVQYREQLS